MSSVRFNPAFAGNSYVNYLKNIDKEKTARKDCNTTTTTNLTVEVKKPTLLKQNHFLLR